MHVEFDEKFGYNYLEANTDVTIYPLCDSVCMFSFSLSLTFFYLLRVFVKLCK